MRFVLQAALLLVDVLVVHMRLFKIFHALAPTTVRGRHEVSWRPLPPSRTVLAHHDPTVSSQVASLLGVITAVTLIGSMVALAVPGEEESGFVVSPTAVAIDDTVPIRLDGSVEFELPEPTVSTFQVASTIADLSFAEERLLTTTTTVPPPTEEELVQAAEVEEFGRRRVHAMTSVGFEEDVVTVVSEFPMERPLPATPADCRDRAREIDLTPDGHWDRNAIARMTWSLFDCVLTVHGLDDASPTLVRGFDGTAWGFESLAEQMAAEAVVVSYCESVGYRHDALTGGNGFGYAGLFQMGTTEMRKFGAGGSRYDPVDNAFGAVNYVWSQFVNRDGYGGWSPWAVVNTGFDDEVNNRVKVPILPRFKSVDPEFHGRRGPDLPIWAVDPWTNDVPSWNGCPYNGGRW